MDLLPQQQPQLQASPDGPKSPKFIKPYEVFLMRKKKRVPPSSPSRSGLSPGKGLPQFSPLKCLDYNSPHKGITANAKSPFKLRKTPKKSETENYLVISEANLKECLSQTKLKAKSPKTTKRQLNFGGVFGSSKSPPISVPAVNLIDEDANLEAPAAKRAKTPDAQTEGVSKLPFDWSLKTRLRFVSHKPFPWRGSFRASEDATGTTSFARCLNSSIEKSGSLASRSPSTAVSSPSHTSHHFSQSTSFSQISQKNHSTSSPGRVQKPLDTSLSAVLKQHCFVWMHPHLPWLNLFPRIDSRQHSKLNGKSTVPPIDPQSFVAEALLNDWTNSFRSLFHLVKVRQCPYFYVCAHSFTVLYRASGVAGCDDIHAMVTPTTVGFRRMLKDEGIAFSMPFLNKDSKCEAVFEEAAAGSEEASQSQSRSQVNGESAAKQAVCDNDEEDESSLFLESLGLSQQDFPSLKPKRPKPGQNTQGSKKKSMALITGPDTQLLINFLSNSRMSVATTGPLAGVPPTLLAPVAFQGATLNSLKLKQSHSSYAGKAVHSLDVCGPLLPSLVKSLSEFFGETQDGNYKANLVTFEASAPFSWANSHLKSSSNLFSVFATESLKDCGLSSQFINDICSKEHQSVESISEIALKQGMFSVR